MTRGAKPTCLCGTCKKCRHREYARRRHAEGGVSEATRAAARERARRWYHEHREEARAKGRERERANREAARRRLEKHYADPANISRRNELARRRYANETEEQREKRRARDAVGRAVKSGRLVRQLCEVCGDPNVQAHHDDYSRRLDVRWLCPVHHGQEHRVAEAA